MMHLIRNDMNIPFVKVRWVGFAISSVLVLMGLIAIIQIARGHAKMGVDFAGGTAVEIEFQKPITSEQLREAMKTPQFVEVSIQTVTDPGHYKYMMRLFAPELPTAQVSTSVVDVLRKKVPANTVSVLSSEDVGPAVSAHLRQQAFMALFVAMSAILIYIWWRFDYRFSVAATIATLHDILAVLGVFYFMGQEINLLLITALLTLAGYSLNDTVVVFDRIRENLRLHRKDELIKVVNNSINETLSRTIITSMCTFLVVVALFFLGGEVIHAFALAMILGIIVGTYSSIFIAANIVVEWNVHSPAPHR
jgi:preprotein translocase subunit SecF